MGIIINDFSLRVKRNKLVGGSTVGKWEIFFIKVLM